MKNLEEIEAVPKGGGISRIIVPDRFTTGEPRRADDDD
jgi:hypothetical protein